MKRKIIISILLAASAALVSCAARQAGQADSSGHPDLTEQEKLIACSECHKNETPGIYDEWYQSVHGIGMVKCYQCHGTFENLAVVPDTSNCAICHSAAMEKCPTDKVCWECHTAHTFKAQK